MRLLDRIRVTKIFFQLVRNPNRTELIFKGVKILSKDVVDGPVVEFEKQVFQDSEFLRMYEENYVPETLSNGDLENLPEHSFGSTLHRHLTDNRLDLSLFPRFQTTRPIEYLSLRVYQDHDLWHALLGYGTSIEDELALQAFGVAQFKSGIGVALIAGGLLHLLRTTPLQAAQALDKVAKGYLRGLNARFVLSIRLHELLSRPLEEVRQICGVT
jgi:ubiquinone biosynthesis protein COQ4